MDALIGLLLGLVLVFGPIIGVSKWYQKRRPNATVGEVGPIILAIMALEILVLFALIAAGG